MMRALGVAGGLLAAGCSMNPQYSAPWTVRSVGKAYEARDACLVNHAALYAGSNADATSVGRIISAQCEAETNALISSSNPHAERDVAAAIRHDSEFRATGYVLKARGQQLVD